MMTTCTSWIRGGLAGLAVVALVACGDDDAGGETVDTHDAVADTVVADTTPTTVPPDTSVDTTEPVDTADVEDAVEDVADSGEDTEDAVEEVADSVEDTVEDAVEDVADTVADTEDAVEDVADAVEDVEDVADVGPMAPCPGPTHGADERAMIGGRCAYYYHEAVLWPDADAACAERGMHLLTIASAEENDAVVAWNSQFQNATWIGLNDRAVEGTFVWSLGDGAASAEPLYRPETLLNGPDNDCFILATVEPGTGEWRALICDIHRRSYTCVFE